jgi:hypothetical protein
MKTILVVLVAAACGSNTPAPDAALPSVHDQLVSEGCDRLYDGGPQICEHGCVVKPTSTPCMGKTPCLDHDGCAAALDRGRYKDCPTTFVVADYTGLHRGCCIAETVSNGDLSVYFYECP